MALATLALATALSERSEAQVFYGVGTGSGTGADGARILAVDIAAGTTTEVFNTGVLQPNAFAWDNDHGYAYYRTANNGSFFLWNPATSSQAAIDTSSIVGSIASSDAAAYYDGAFWFIAGSTDDLVRLTFDVSNPLAPTFTEMTVFDNFDGTGTTSFSFGDIVITPSGMLYGVTSSGSFFRADVSSGTPTNYVALGSTGQSLQLGWDATTNALFGVNTTSGLWYMINLTNGALTQATDSGNNPVSSSPQQIRDLGDSVAIPEPATFASLLVAGFTLLVTRRRRRD